MEISLSMSMFFYEWLPFWLFMSLKHIDGLMQDCSISSSLAMEILQSFTKPSIYFFIQIHVPMISPCALCMPLETPGASVRKVTMATSACAV